MNVRFREVLEDAIGGGWGEDEPADGLVPVRVVRGADFPAAATRNITSAPLRYEPLKKAASRVLREGDIVLEVSGGTKDRPTGRSIYVSAQLLSSVSDDVIPASFCRLVRVDRTKAHPAFIYYALQDLYDRGGTWEFQNQSTGISNFQFEMFCDNWRLDIPPLAQQQSIAEVLGALDDKIAANTALAATAWALAETDFRSAQAESSKERLRLGDVASLEYGKALPATLRERGEVAVVGSGGVTGEHSVALVDRSGVVVGRKGSAGSVHWVSGPHFPIDTTFYVRGVRGEISQPYLYFLLRTLRLDEMNNDSAVPGLNRADALSSPVVVPGAAVLRAFTVRTSALIQLVETVDAENRTLAATRDALLPQLMSGKLRVRDAEAAASAVI